MPEAATRLVPTPLGALLLTASGGRLVGLDLPPNDDAASRDDATPSEIDDAVLATAADQLAEYFVGERRTFDVDVDLGGTDFQRRVWAELRRIPYGTTISYGELARRIGRPGAARAVGMANNRNPIAIVVPCHRVVGADGSLVGYGGGLDAKRALLELEGALLPA